MSSDTAVSWVPVRSSNLKQVAYVPSSGTMYVEFNSGARYCFYDVPEPVYSGLLHSPSKGTYFNDVMRSGYHYERIF